MKITQLLLTKNKYSRPGTALKAVTGVVVHYVGNPGSTAEGNRNYFESLKVGKKNAQGKYISASSHYIIGLRGEIVQCVPENEVAYHAGEKSVNESHIGIECCHPLSDGKFTNATYDSLVLLIGDICKRYGLNPLTDVIRHFDVTGKACPLYHVNNPGAWEGLKRDVAAAMGGGKLPEAGCVNVRYLGAVTEIRAEMVNGSYMAKMSELARVFGEYRLPVRDVLESLGLTVDYEANTMTILVDGSSPIGAADGEVLCKIVQAEAGGEDAKGRILVANVILNRVRDKNFPKTVKDVVFQESQFEPTRNGAYDKAVPTSETIECVSAALNGVDYSQGATYFRTAKGAAGSWHEAALTFLFEHGGHRFYM